LASGDAGGVVVVPSGRPEYLLQVSEIAQLRETVREWKSRYAADPTTVWDIEFGFVDGKLWLFQIRPFVRFRSSALLERLRVLDQEVMRNADRPVSMREAV
jgi:hypothetical protein